MSDFSAFFKWALDGRQATPTDPTLALTKRAKDLKKAAVKVQRHYSPFETEQLRRIFSPKHYVCFNRSADHFWAPLPGLHLGTRLKEVVTLSLDDIDLHKQSGVWFLDVTPELAKDVNSVRRLPLPRQHVDLGFLEYVRHVRELGAARLFPHVGFERPTLRKDPSKYCSRRFGSYLDTLGLKDPDLVFHSFRHTMVSALQDANVPLADAMQITRHQAQDHAVKTGRMTTAQAQSLHVKV